VSDTAPAVFEFRVERADALTGRALLDAYLSDLRVRIDGFDEARSVSAAPEEMAPPGGAFLVGYLAGRPVACGGIKDRGDATAEVKRMWVAPEARRRGLGRRLLAALEEAARAAGHDRVVLDTSARQPEALALYLAAGYAEVPDYNGNPYAAHWFTKAL
jgi:GNAT superfamily N-acetyltransferase